LRKVEQDIAKQEQEVNRTKLEADYALEQAKKLISNDSDFKIAQINAKKYGLTTQNEAKELELNGKYEQANRKKQMRDEELSQAVELVKHE